MASLEVGHVYVVWTALARSGPKNKITLCVSADESLFLWFNTNSAHHGIGQLSCSPSDHQALDHDCYLDLSRLTFFSPGELATARDRGVISNDLCDRVLEMLRHGIETLPPRHARLIQENLSKFRNR